MTKDKITLPKGTQVPDHLAMILDGNRRWARAKGLNPWEGHRAGYKAVLELAETARRWGVHTFTVWVWSTENWQRPAREINEIMYLLRTAFRKHTVDFHKDKVQFVHLGSKVGIPKDIVEKISVLEKATKDYNKYTFNLAFNYGGHDEIIRAVQRIIKDKIPAEKIDDKLFESYLDTAGQPYPFPDLFIRTSGEQRTSGLLPWQMGYTEFYFEQDHLPDFTPEKLKLAILDYSRRRRRFGGNDAVEHLKFRPEVVAKFELAWWRLSKIPEGMRLRDYTLKHLREQYGLSKSLAFQAAKYMLSASHEQNNGRNWEKAKRELKKFYKLIKGELKLAFEPSLVASLQVKLWQDVYGRETAESIQEAENTARELYAEVYRISLFQASKAAHLQVLANIERNLAEKGQGEEHWKKAEDYLQKFYTALKERVA
jgi:undecaprenyl diphosphate synthase